MSRHAAASDLSQSHRRPSPLTLDLHHHTKDPSQQPLSPPSARVANERRNFALNTPSPTAPDRVRAPNPAKRAVPDPELDAIRAAVTADAVREEAKRAAQALARVQAQAQPASYAREQAITPARNVTRPQVPGTIIHSSPPTSPTMTTLTKATRPENRTIMPRTASIDSTVSSISTSTVASQRPNLPRGVESAGPQDVASVVAAAGSAEAAIQKLINEKQSAASHNAQLWRLVEKQRAMILGLNKDLEKSLKEKERYRKKLKDHLVQSQSAPALTTASSQTLVGAVGREGSQSPALLEQMRSFAPPAAVRDMSLDSRKVSDASEVASIGPGRSDTPQDATNLPSSGLPTPLSTISIPVATRELDRMDIPVQALSTPTLNKPAAPFARTTTGTPEPISPRADETGLSPKSQRSGHFYSNSITAISPPASAASFSTSSKQASRKAPPAPLNLSPRTVEPSVLHDIVDASESEYEDEPQGERADRSGRGRRKTREEDDRKRETMALQEEEHRSKSKKSKKSKSKSLPPAEKPAITEQPLPIAAEQPDVRGTSEQKQRLPIYQTMSDPAAIVRQRAASDAAGLLQRNITAPSLLSPGLPMSPRPGDRPPNSPLPRAPKVNAMPLSPRFGNGLPLSPRPPKQPIPMPPQTPLAFTSPHLARAEAYQLQQPTLPDLLKPSPEPSPESERPSTASDSKIPGDVYTGLMTEQYPDLLLPPNALPSIFVKIASSRMRPSRLSYIAPKTVDENPVFTLAIHARSDNKQLWRVEKTLTALATLDQRIKANCRFRDRLPDKTLFVGHAPARIDARRMALDSYFERMMDAVTDEKTARIVCKFLSTDAIGAESVEYFPPVADGRPDSPMNKQRPRREGYLTKRGKNFGGWKARYFVLDGPSLKYFEAPGGAQLGSIKLQNAQIGKQSANAQQNSVEDEDNQFRHAFLILEPKRKDSSSLVRHVLCAESDEERDSWVDALLQYVDARDDSEAVNGQGTVPVSRTDMPRSPRLQKSMNDLRASSRPREVEQPRHPDLLRTVAVGYEQTVAGDAPIMGPPSARKLDTPSPPWDSNFHTFIDQSATNHPMISAPSNAHVIQNAGEWGMRPPPTPGQQKDKKRSLFSGFRGRSSSDLASHERAPSGMFPETLSGQRAVFGVPLREAVDYAHPAGITTELPAVVYRCIEYLLDKDAVSEEGIFRLSGSNTVIKALRERFNTEGDINLVAEGKYYDMHAVASLLKLYLRELPASILTRELHLEFLQCLELNSRDKTIALNILVNRLPRCNRALLETLSAFLLSIVSNADVNKMNVKNVGIVFAPTLNVPGPLISCFVEDQAAIFGEPIDEAESPIAAHEPTTTQSTDLRSPRKQMFTDLPTPAYNQTFQSSGAYHGNQHNPYDTGMAPIRPVYANYQMAPQGEGGFGSLNDALRSPAMFSSSGGNNGASSSSSRDAKAKRRESGMMFMTPNQGGPQHKQSMSRLREEEGASF